MVAESATLTLAKIESKTLWPRPSISLMTLSQGVQIRTPPRTLDMLATIEEVHLLNLSSIRVTAKARL